MHIRRSALQLVFIFGLLILLGLIAAVTSAYAAPRVSGLPGHSSTSAPKFIPGARPSEAPMTITIITLDLIGTYKSNLVDKNAAESVSHDPASQRLFVVNAVSTGARIDIIDISNPATPSKSGQIDTSPYGAEPTSVDVHSGVLAVAVVHTTPTLPGTVAFFDTSGVFSNAVTVGPQPDMLTFTPDGQKVLVANEGEPAQYCPPNDPEGSVSIIDISGGVAGATVSTAGFTAFNGAALDPSVRILTNTVAQDLEPEEITVSADSKTAWVSLQENNALAILDIQTGVISDVVGLDFKDHSLPGNGLDASDVDGGINIKTWPVKGMFQPDGVAAYQAAGSTYIVTANEGDGRRVPCPSNPSGIFTDEIRVGDDDFSLDPAVFPNFGTLELRQNLGRLKVSEFDGNTDSDGQHEALFAFGARSFSIWTAAGQRVFDSGDDFEKITAARFPNDFNSEHDVVGSKDKRSDNRGPEPEAITTGLIGARTYAFIGLEQIGGVMVYDVTDPTAPAFKQYVNTRNFGGTTLAAAGDLGPADLLFIPASESPTGKPLLVVANSVSGTTTIFEIAEVTLALDEVIFLPLIVK